MRLLFLPLLAFFSVAFVAPPLMGQVRKALMVIVDGISADVLEQSETPHIDAVIKNGAYTRAFVGGEKGGYSQTPTISAVSYNSMLTGTWVNKHNVWNNAIAEPNYNYPTIFRLLRSSMPEKKLAIYSTWTDNRTKLLGENLAATGHLQLDFVYDGYELDTLQFPHRGDYIHQIDERVVANATASLRRDGPDLSWVYLQYTDDVGHAYGDGPALHEALKHTDRQVGELYEAIRLREQAFNEDWLMVIVTDHGRDIISGKNHGGQSVRERTSWLVTNKPHMNRYFYTYTPAIVDILPSVARHLQLALPRDIQFELDGVPLLGEVSVADPSARLLNDQLRVEWTPLEAEGNVSIWLATENRFEATGVSDQYRLLTTVPAKVGKMEMALSADLLEKNFFKVVIEGEKNVLNRWIVR